MGQPIDERAGLKNFKTLLGALGVKFPQGRQIAFTYELYCQF